MRRIGSRLIARPPARSAGYAAGYPVQGKGSWTPAKLFASGVAGAWYEPSPTTCYTDVAMTTLSGVGDTVAATADLSGNGNHRTQATAGKMPILQQTAGGLYYLEYDGIDDFLAASIAGLSVPIVTIMAANFVDSADDVFVDGTTSTQSLLRLYTGKYRLFSGVNLTATSGPTAGSTHVVTGIVNGVSSLIREDGVEVAAGDAGSNSPGGITTGARYDGSLAAAIHEYGVLRIATNEDVSQAERYFARLAGVAL